MKRCVYDDRFHQIYVDDGQSLKLHVHVFFKLMFGLIVNFAFLFEKVFFNTCYLAITLDRVL